MYWNLPVPYNRYYKKLDLEKKYLISLLNQIQIPERDSIVGNGYTFKFLVQLTLDVSIGRNILHIK